MVPVHVLMIKAELHEKIKILFALKHLAGGAEIVYPLLSLTLNGRLKTDVVICVADLSGRDRSEKCRIAHIHTIDDALLPLIKKTNRKARFLKQHVPIFSAHMMRPLEPVDVLSLFKQAVP